MAQMNELKNKALVTQALLWFLSFMGFVEMKNTEYHQIYHVIATVVHILVGYLKMQPKHIVGKIVPVIFYWVCTQLCQCCLQLEELSTNMNRRDLDSLGSKCKMKTFSDRKLLGFLQKNEYF